MNTKKFIAEIDEAELACRIAEGVLGLRRPDGATACEAVDGVSNDADWRSGARMALQYITECINEAKVPS
jgi:hypothetical protein